MIATAATASLPASVAFVGGSLGGEVTARGDGDGGDKSSRTFGGESTGQQPKMEETMTRALKSLMVAGFAATLAAAANAQEVDWGKVDAALGRKAAVTGDVH